MLKAINFWFTECWDSEAKKVKKDPNGINYSFRKVAKQFELNDYSLRKRIQEKMSIDASRGRPRYFSDEEESVLANYVKIMSRLGFALNSFEIIRLNKFRYYMNKL